MAVNGLLVCALVAALMASAVASPRDQADSETKRAGSLQQLLVRKEAARGAKDAVDQAARTRATRMDKLANLSGDEREFMSKQIMQAISEMMNSDCSSGRDYQGWVDFGRRSAE